MNDRLTPEYWHHRAAEARAVADMFSDEHSKDTMLRIAEAYEKMAQTAKQIEEGLALIGKRSPPAPTGTKAEQQGVADAD